MYLYSIQFKFICIALFTIQSLQSALQEIQPDLTAIRTYFTRWLIRTNSYDLTRTNSYDFC